MKYLVFSLLILVCLSSCERPSKYDASRYFDKATQDTIMTNIITNIYKVPKGADPKRKRELEYRKLYANQLPQFQFVHYHIDQRDSVHYFYLIRPARNEKGYKRGVLGKYRVDRDNNLLDFEEIANTPMLPENEILEKGEFLWDDLMYYGNIDRYYLNKAFIEFPDDRTRYDRVKKEWTYEKL